MSRSDGTFPNYVRLDIDPDVWPEDYWNRAFVCKGCGTAWPATHLFDPSPCCNAMGWPVDAPPEMRWPEAVAALKAARFGAIYDEWNEGVDDEQLAWAELMTDGELDDSKLSAEIDRLIEDANSERC
jgi:hypothetical protein